MSAAFLKIFQGLVTEMDAAREIHDMKVTATTRKILDADVCNLYQGRIINQHHIYRSMHDTPRLLELKECIQQIQTIVTV